MSGLALALNIPGLEVEDESGVPTDALRDRNNEPILDRNGDYILTRETE